MALKPANMDKCDPKCKCSFGVNADIAFACDDPCAGAYQTFNSQTCDCDDDFLTGYYFYGWTADWDTQVNKGASPVVFIDIEQGGYMFATGRSVYACQVDSTLPASGYVPWFQGTAKSSYMSEGSGGCSLAIDGQIYCTSDTVIWPYYSLGGKTTANAASTVITPFLNGVPCFTPPANTTRSGEIELFYAETYVEAEALRSQYLGL